MNIKGIIGLGLLTYFTNCDTPVVTIGLNNQPANCILRPHAQQTQQPRIEVRPAPVVCNDVRPQQPNQQPNQPLNQQHFHIDGKGRI